MAEKEKKGKTVGKEKPKKEAKETKEPAAGKAQLESADSSVFRNRSSENFRITDSETQLKQRLQSAKKAGAKEAKAKEATKGKETSKEPGEAEAEAKAEPKAGRQESEHVKAEIAHKGKPAYKGKKQGKRTEKQAWVDYSPADVEKLVASLAAAGHNSAEIGTMLAEQYAVPSVKAITGKRIEKIMAAHKALGEIPRDLLDLIKKSVKLLNHMKQNKKDMSAKRGYEITVSKIRKAAAYYAKNGKIRAGWRYTPEEAVLLVK